MNLELHFQTATLTDPGGREVNEDALGVLGESPLRCWILCDGLGGHGAGDVAANLAASTLLRDIKTLTELNPPAILTLLTQANQALLEAQSADAAGTKMHSTAVLLCTLANQAFWAHIGDSRLYHFRGGRIIAQTLDHSLVQANVNAGNLEAGQIRFHEDRDRLLRSLGSGGEIKPTLLAAPVQLEAGDAFLLASDGFWELVLESEMESSLTESSSAEDWLRRMHNTLRLRAANVEEADNYSAIAIRLDLVNHE